jgi:type IV pilus assembly protein PilY1
VHCAKSFVILLTDGASTSDLNVPAGLKNYDADTHESDRSYDSNGSDYLDDIALYARTTDLRSSTVGKSDLDGDQNMILYAIYAFGNEQNARDLLMDAARNGGFIDKSGNNRPDLQEEWDADGNGVPDTYFEAQDGYKLESELLKAINDILKRAASGTAVSVLATKGEGEGTLVQAFFKPVVPSGLEEIKWTGYLQSLWVDQYGNTREDTNGNHSLDLDQDDIILFYLDQGTGETKIKVYEVGAGSEYPDIDPANPDSTKTLEEIEAIWEAGDMLASRNAGDRKIFTYTGDTAGELEAGKVIEFTTANAGDMGKFFGVEDDATWGYLGATYDNRVNNIICFVRGVDDDSADYQGDPEIRPRTIDGRLWKLGDIVYSTPVSISKPVENYGLLYDDMTYKTFFQKYKGRETVVYVGANDGMLHAFTSGVYVLAEQKFEKISLVSGYGLPDSLGIGDVEIGSELWAYIPQNLLPHLKWLPREDYTHVSYVDLKPKVVDARIFTGDADTSDNATHPGGWGTILIGGLNKGGKDIQTDNGTFSPCFFAMDITNPRSPQLLWEKTFPDLGLATNTPCILSVGNQWDGTQWSAGQWYLAISSGPTDYDGNSNQNGHVYIVDLLTGGEVHYRDFPTTDANACMNPPVAFDKGMNYNVDGIYVSANFGNWEGRLWKITVPQAGSPTDFDPLSTDYDESPANWTWTKLFYSPKPITAPVTLSIDRRDNAWIFGGTGRYMEESDKTTTDQNFLFGIKDPFFNAYRDDQTCYHKYGTECEINSDDHIDQHLFDADVFTSGTKNIAIKAG